jgi:hypothetical protein
MAFLYKYRKKAHRSFFLNKIKTNKFTCKTFDADYFFFQNKREIERGRRPEILIGSWVNHLFYSKVTYKITFITLHFSFCFLILCSIK